MQMQLNDVSMKYIIWSLFEIRGSQIATARQIIDGHLIVSSWVGLTKRDALIIVYDVPVKSTITGWLVVVITAAAAGDAAAAGSIKGPASLPRHSSNDANTGYRWREDKLLMVHRRTS